MNDLEDRVRTALEAEAATVRPRSGALEENRRRLHRAVRLRRAAIPAVAALSAATVTLGAFVVVKDRPSAGPAGPAEPRPVKDVTQLVSMSSVVTIAGRLTGGADFRVEALGSDGSVLGRSPDSTVWEADGRHPRPKSLGVRAQGGLATGPGFRAWVTPVTDELRCRSVSDGRVKVISPQSTWVAFGFWVSGEMLAWHDGVGQPHATRACERGRFLFLWSIRSHAGEIVALSGTHLFSTDPISNKHLRELDVNTGRLRLHPLPAGIPKFDLGPPSSFTEGTYVPPVPENWDVIRRWYAAATPDVFAWAAGGRLRATDRRTWRHTIKLPARPPAAAPGTRAVMTAGDHVVAYTARTATQGWRSVLYNTRTGGTIAIPGQAYAAGDYLLWRQGADYRLAKVSGP